MKQQLAAALVITCLCLGSPKGVSAQLKDNLEINLFGSGSWYTSKRFEISSPQAIRPVQGLFRLDHAIRGGARVGVYSRGHWSEEFFYSYEPNKVHLIRLSTPSQQASINIQVHNYGINALYYLNDDETQKVRPFLSIGVGGTLYRLTREAQAFVRDPLRGNIPDMDNSHELTLNYGFGVKTRSSGWLGLRADVRGFIGRNPSFGLARKSDDPNATVFPASGPIQNAEASAGLVFYFFGKR